MTINIYKQETFSRNFINKRLDKINKSLNTKQFISQIAELIFKLSGNVNVTQRLNVIVYRGQ